LYCRFLSWRYLLRRRINLIGVMGITVGVGALSVYLDRRLTDFKKPLTIELNGATSEHRLQPSARILCESLLERRRNMSVNLARTLIDYAAHEKDLFRHVSNMRASFSGIIGQSEGEASPSAQKPAAAGPAGEPAASAGSSDAGKPSGPRAGKAPKLPGGLQQVLDYLNASAAGELTSGNGVSGLLAFAEQYPDLKLSANFQRAMDALVEVEKDIATERIKAADFINTYTTRRMTFPGNVFAAMYGFEEIPYHQAAPEARRFEPVEY